MRHQEDEIEPEKTPELKLGQDHEVVLKTLASEHDKEEVGSQ